MFARYAAVSGTDVDLDRVRYHRVSKCVRSLFAILSFTSQPSDAPDFAIWQAWRLLYIDACQALAEAMGGAGSDEVDSLYRTHTDRSSGLVRRWARWPTERSRRFVRIKTGFEGAVMRRVVVIGAGSAGCVVAARLTEDSDTSVVLLEAGPDYPDVHAAPADIRSAFVFAGTDHDWGYVSDGVTARADAVNLGGTSAAIPVLRGKVVGGSSAVNGTSAMRSTPSDFDRWVAAGNDDWSWPQVLPYFRKIETIPRREIGTATTACCPSAGSKASSCDRYSRRSSTRARRAESRWSATTTPLARSVPARSR